MGLINLSGVLFDLEAVRSPAKAGLLTFESFVKFMQSKISLKWLLFTATITGAIFCLIIIFPLIVGLLNQGSYAEATSFASNHPSQTLKSTALEETVGSKLFASSADEPVRLKIPKIKVDIALEPIGLTPEGAVGVSKSLANAAWFNLGPRPGDNGNAVITGHYGRWKNGVLGVFNNLYKLRRGDRIYIRDKKEATIAFVVRELRTYGRNENAPDVFVSSDGGSHLNLITCGGVWDKHLQQYTRRLVVFADKE